MQDGKDVDYEGDGLPTIEEEELLECERFKNLYLFGKMLGGLVPMRTMMSKTKSDWMPSRETKYLGIGNGFMLIKFTNEMDCYYKKFDFY